MSHGGDPGFTDIPKKEFFFSFGEGGGEEDAKHTGWGKCHRYFFVWIFYVSEYSASFKT